LTISSHDNYKILKVEGERNDSFISIGTHTKIASKKAREVFSKYDTIDEIFLSAYEHVADEQVGGTLTIYFMTKGNIRQRQHKIKDKRHIKRVIFRDDIHHNATDGIRIERNFGTKSNPKWQDTFFVDIDGKIVADSIEIRNSFITKGAIKGATLEIGHDNSVFKADYNGIYLGNQNFNLAPFSVDLDGNLKANKAKFYGNAGQLLIDTEDGKLYLDNFDIIGAGRIDAEYLTVNTITANDGYITDLTVNKLKTIGNNDKIGTYVDHIDIKDNVARWLTSEITGRTQAKTHNDEPLYWADSSKTKVTSEVTPYPVYQLQTDDIEKLIITFEGSGHDAYPYIAMGAGSGAGEGLYARGKGFIIKPKDEFIFRYVAPMTDDLRQVTLHNTGINVESQNGYIKFNHSSGTSFEINEPGTEIKMTNANGSYIQLASNGDINIFATGNVKINGTRIDLN
jgi:hypothetical protein